MHLNSGFYENFKLALFLAHQKDTYGEIPNFGTVEKTRGL